MTFRFGMQKLLELREHREQSLAVQLLRARLAAEEARRLEGDLTRARAGEDRPAARPEARTIRIGQLQNRNFLLEHLDTRLAEARAEVERADSEVAARIDAFAHATRERQVLHKLRDRQHEAARRADAEHDRKMMDELALMRFVRHEPGREGEGA